MTLLEDSPVQACVLGSSGPGYTGPWVVSESKGPARGEGLYVGGGPEREDSWVGWE